MEIQRKAIFDCYGPSEQEQQALTRYAQTQISQSLTYGTIYFLSAWLIDWLEIMGNAVN